MLQNDVIFEEESTTKKFDKWKKTIRDLSIGTSWEKEVESALLTIDNSYDDKDIKISFVGAPKSGKSSIINALLDRKILPVSVLPSSITFEIQSTVNKQDETFCVEESCLPLEELCKTISSIEEKKELYRIVLTIFSDWLGSKPFTILEKASLDFSDFTNNGNVDQILQNSDLVVLVIDSLMPMKKTEVVLLKECVNRKLPIVVVLSKMDLIAMEDRNNLISFVKKHVDSCSTDIYVIETQIDSDNKIEINNIKSVIENLVDKTNIYHVRTHQIVLSFIKVVELIRESARVESEIQIKLKEADNQEIEKNIQKIDGQSILWAQIDQNLMERRQNIEQYIRHHLEENSQIILEKLLSELETTKDIKVWWEHDMEIHLQQAIQRLALQISSSVNQKIASDLKWLQEELLYNFNYSFEISIESILSTDEKSIKKSKLILPDDDKQKVIIKIGTVAVVVMAGTMLITSSILGIVLATGTITGLVAEKLIRSNSAKDREKIRNELKAIISQTIIEYSLTFSAKLRDKYDLISHSLKEDSLKWKQEQLLKIETNREGMSTIEFDKIVQEISILLNEISSELVKIG